MSETPTILVEKIDPKAIIPCKPKSFFDAGWDVYCLERKVIPAGGDALLSTGLRVAIPNGFCIQVNPRSGKAVRDKLVIGARVVDAPYRGELKIHVINFGKEPVEISPNDPCAQLLVLPCASILMEGKIHDIETERGADGFGSSNGDLIKNAQQERKEPTSYSDPGYMVADAYQVVQTTNDHVEALKELDYHLECGNTRFSTKDSTRFRRAIKFLVNHFK